MRCGRYRSQSMLVGGIQHQCRACNHVSANDLDDPIYLLEATNMARIAQHPEKAVCTQ